jgi:hypothetical protein
VPLLVAEPATEVVRNLLREDATIVAWWASRVECASALARLSRASQGVIAGDTRRRLDALWRGVLEVEPRDAVRAAALRLLEVHPLRAADALQLAAALTWREGAPRGAPFVCLDERLGAAARAEGFEILPGAA